MVRAFGHLMRVVTFLVLSIAMLTGCRDSPIEVVESASEAAAGGDLVTMQEAFSVATVQRLERAWQLNQTNKGQGWQDLAAKLTFDGKPLEVKDEKIYGEYARVDARAGALNRDYYLRKEDGRWRIELGAGMRFRKYEGEAKAKEAKAEAKEKKKEG